MKQRLSALIMMTVSVINLYAEGGPPMYTDGPGTPGDGNWEINTGVTGTLTSSNKRYELPIIDINYGLGKTIQLKVEANNIYHNENDLATNGIGNIKAGVKWRFYDHEGWMISTYPQLGYAPIKSHLEKGLAEYNTIMILPIEMTKRSGSIWATGEVGYILIDHQKERMKYGLIGGYDINKKLTVMAEIFGNQKLAGGDEMLLANIGMNCHFNDQIGLLVSIGKELKTTETERAIVFFSGIQVLF